MRTAPPSGIPRTSHFILPATWIPSLLEVVSKPQIRFKGKAQADRESAAYEQYVSIYRRSATQPLSLRWGFETTSKQIALFADISEVHRCILKADFGCRIRYPSYTGRKGQAEFQPAPGGCNLLADQKGSAVFCRLAISWSGLPRPKPRNRCLIRRRKPGTHFRRCRNACA